MSVDMFPDPAITYLLEHARGEDDWMEHAVAHHSNKAHDDFYDMIGEDLHHLHTVYYPNCGEVLEYYIAESERDLGPQAWVMTPYGSLWRVKGYESAVASFAGSNPDWLVFMGPDSADEVGQELHRKSGNIVMVESVAVTDGTEMGGANLLSMADSVVSVAGVETDGCSLGRPCDACRFCSGPGWEQSGTDVGTDPLVTVVGRGVSGPVAIQP